MNVKRKNMGKISLHLWIMIALGVSWVPYSIIYKIKQTKAQNHIENSLSDDSSVVDPVATNKMTRLGKRLSDLNPKFHVAVTASDTPYSKWQMRIMYYWYKKFKDTPQGSDMGDFTRILHSGKPDNLMDEIPTSVVDPIPFDIAKGYVVLNRPWAFVQWLAKVEIEEEYIFRGEPDHILVKPLPNLSHGNGSNPVAYPFFYIKPTKFERLLRKFYPEEMGPITNIDPIGNSPVIIRKSLLKEIAPTWMNISLLIKNDPETDKTFGWVQEMYGYAVASALHGVKHTLLNDFMTQPPYMEADEYFIVHYTYACNLNMKGKLLVYGKGKGKEKVKGKGEWSFDKRDYLDSPVPRNLTMPPPGAPENVVLLVKRLNEATANIPDWDSSL